MAAEAGYTLDLDKELGSGGHATTYRSDADLSWGLLAPILLPRGWKHVCTPSALLRSWAAARTLAGCSSSQPVLVSCPTPCVGWLAGCCFKATVAAQLAVHTSAATEPCRLSGCRVCLVASPSRLRVQFLMPLLCPVQYTQSVTMLQGSQEGPAWPGGGHSL